MALAIEISDLGVAFGGQVVLENFRLEVAPGEKVVLAGASGSGKSTILKCVLGLAVPQRGTITVLGTPVDGSSIWSVRHNLAYVAQEPELGDGTVREVFNGPFAFRANAAERERLEQVPALLDRFNLPQSLLDKDVSALSGGEKQRVALISAIVLQRPVILLDEASSALDKANRQAMAEYFKQAAELTILAVAHDIDGATFAGRVVEIKAPAVSTGRHP